MQARREREKEEQEIWSVHKNAFASFLCLAVFFLVFLFRTLSLFLSPSFSSDDYVHTSYSVSAIARVTQGGGTVHCAGGAIFANARRAGFNAGLTHIALVADAGTSGWRAETVCATFGCRAVKSALVFWRADIIGIAIALVGSNVAGAVAMAQRIAGALELAQIAIVANGALAHTGKVATAAAVLAAATLAQLALPIAGTAANHVASLQIALATAIFAIWTGLGHAVACAVVCVAGRTGACAGGYVALA